MVVVVPVQSGRQQEENEQVYGLSCVGRKVEFAPEEGWNLYMLCALKGHYPSLNKEERSHPNSLLEVCFCSMYRGEGQALERGLTSICLVCCGGLQGLRSCIGVLWVGQISLRLGIWPTKKFRKWDRLRDDDCVVTFKDQIHCEILSKLGLIYAVFLEGQRPL